MKASSALLLSALAVAVAAACGSPNGTPIDGGTNDTGGDGHVNATCPPKPNLKCMDPPPSYKNDVEPIVKERCAPCHFPGGISDQVEDFSTLAGVANAGTAIINQLVGPPPCQMPPINGNAMYGIAPGTADQEDTLVQWILCGEPNN